MIINLGVLIYFKYFNFFIDNLNSFLALFGVGSIGWMRIALPDNELTMTLSWIAATAYTFQIYFDFAGYSDMAIGLGRMMGFKFPENFNNPYISRNITEFWQRWHISLSTWFRDYLFLPIAYYFTDRMSKKRYFNIKTDYILYIIAASVTFVLCGFWHGAAWNFVLWGAYHGFFIILDKLFLKKLLKKTGKAFSTIFTFLIVILGWVIFRTEEMPRAWAFYRHMFSFDFSIQDKFLSSEFVTIFILAFCFSFITVSKTGRKLHDAIFLQKYSKRTYIILSVASLILLVLSASYINSSGFNPFIYFRF